MAHAASAHIFGGGRCEKQIIALRAEGRCKATGRIGTSLHLGFTFHGNILRVPPLCRSPSARQGCPPYLATAWHANEIFVKYDATGHKTGALTFRLTAIARAPKKSHAHAR